MPYLALLISPVPLCSQQTRQYELLKAIRRQLSELLQEMCRRKSFEAAIEEPLFLTWSLSKFGRRSLLAKCLPLLQADASLSA